MMEAPNEIWLPLWLQKPDAIGTTKGSDSDIRYIRADIMDVECEAFIKAQDSTIGGLTADLNESNELITRLTKRLGVQKSETIEDIVNMFLCKSCRQKNEKILEKYDLF